MFITLLVSLYTSRVVLNVLGAEDYGIYSIAGSIVVLFSFLSNALVGASQRFFSYELGRKDDNTEALKELFSTSLLVHLLIAFVIVALCETLGLWYFDNRLVVPAERYDAASIVYQLSIATFVFNVIRIPFNAIIISHEKMDFYAYLSIVEVALKLFIVYLLCVASFDKLILYAILMFSVTVICTLIYIYYCLRKFPECSLKIRWNSCFFKQLFSYTGWSFCVNMTNVTAQQGGNLMVNNFFGVLLNTAYGLADQVSGIIYGFVTNFQMAFRPQIVKLYASGNIEDLWVLVQKASKMSFYLLTLVSIPTIINIDFIFNIWLAKVPEYSTQFCTLIIVYCLIDAIQAPLWMTIDATGRIKVYSIWLTAILILNLPLAYVIMKFGGPPSTFLIIRVVLNFVTAVIRTIYMYYFISFPVVRYCKTVLRCLSTFIICFVISYIIKLGIDGSVFGNLMSCFLSATLTLLLILVYGLAKEERIKLLAIFRR
jgi:O-antigen/teichoic acid export membrane protein